MSCQCRDRAQTVAAAARKRARAAEGQLVSRLEAFQIAIQDGARQLAARHLYRAGVYLCSLRGNLERDVSPWRVMDVLDNDPLIGEELKPLIVRNRSLIERQAEELVPREMLRGILRAKGRAAGLLRGNAERELEQARKALDRYVRLEDHLAAWREGLRAESQVAVIPLMDSHGLHSSSM